MSVRLGIFNTRYYHTFDKKTTVSKVRERFEEIVGIESQCIHVRDRFAYTNHDAPDDIEVGDLTSPRIVVSHIRCDEHMDHKHK